MNLSEDTIAAISTPPGRGGIGIVRLSGPRAREIAEPLLRLRHPLATGAARFGHVVDFNGSARDAAGAGQVLDEAVVTFFAAPHSYTSEDVVEIAAHGAPVLLEHILRACIAGGARLAEPGEFTQRAFLSGRLDLTQAEAVHDLIESTTLQQARVAARQLGGSLSALVKPIKEPLVALIAALEAGIDFAEDDIDLLPQANISAQLAPMQLSLGALAGSFSYGRVLRDGFSLALVGRPNVGKSSLFNRLVERERAIVTAAPGTTRDPIRERVAMEGVPVELIDTAGLRDAPLDEAEQMGIARSRQAMAEADIVVLVRDAQLPEGEEVLVPAELGHAQVVIALNKSDLLPEPNSAVSACRAASGGVPVILTSAVTGAGIAELRAAILGVLRAAAPTADTALITNLRQQQAVLAAVEGLTAARAAIGSNTPHEMVMLDLYRALDGLDQLTGRTSTEDILARIFSAFCIGK